MVDVKTVGIDLTAAQQDETLADLAFFLDEFGSTRAVRAKLQEQQNDLKRLWKQVQRLLSYRGDHKAHEEEEEEKDTSTQQVGVEDVEDLDETMVDLDFFLKTYGSTRAVREELRIRSQKIANLHCKIQRFQTLQAAASANGNPNCNRRHGYAGGAAEVATDRPGRAEDIGEKKDNVIPTETQIVAIPSPQSEEHDNASNDKEFASKTSKLSVGSFGDASDLSEQMAPRSLTSSRQGPNNVGTDSLVCETVPASRNKCDVCRHPGCTKWPQVNGLCYAHGGYHLCKMEGCTRSAISRKLCRNHGGGTNYKLQRHSLENKDSLTNQRPRSLAQACSSSSNDNRTSRATCKFLGCMQWAKRDGDQHEYCFLHRDGSVSRDGRPGSLTSDLATSLGDVIPIETNGTSTLVAETPDKDRYLYMAAVYAASTRDAPSSASTKDFVLRTGGFGNSDIKNLLGKCNINHMLDVSTVGTDLTPEQQDETISDLAFFLDEFGSTSAVRIKLQEQESDIKRLKKQLESLKNGNSDDEEGEEDFFYAEDNEQTMGDVDDTMVDLQFFLQTYGSTRAVREKLERQRHKIMRLQRTARRIQERRQSEAVSDTSSDEEFSRIGPTPTSTKEEGDIEVALQQYESQTQPGDDDGNGPRVEKNCSDDCSTMDKATDADMRDPALQSAFQAQPLHPESAPTLGEISYRGLKTALNCGIGGLEELVELDHNKATNSNSCNDDGYALDGYALDASREDDASATASETNSDDDTSMIGRQPENENHATGEPGVNIDASAEVSMRSADVLMAPTVCGGDECVDEEKDGCHLRAASLTNLTSNEIPNYIELVAKALRHASELCAESKASSVSSESKDTELSGEENFSENPSVDATETNSINDSDDAVSEFEEDPAFGCRSKRFCRYPNCNNWSKVNGLCRRHGGYRICTADGCDQKAITRNLCRFHGGGTKCKVDECEKFAKYKGYCRRHGRELVVDTRKSCRFQGCNKLGMEEGYCRDHQVTSTGGVENAILSVQAGPSIEKHEVVSRKRGGNESKPAFTLKRAGHKNCKVPRCNKWAMPSGYCSKHQDLPLNKEKLAQPK